MVPDPAGIRGIYAQAHAVDHQKQANAQGSRALIDPLGFGSHSARILKVSRYSFMNLRPTSTCGVSTTCRVSPRATFMRVSISLGITTPVDVPTAVSFRFSTNKPSYNYKYNNTGG